MKYFGVEYTESKFVDSKEISKFVADGYKILSVSYFMNGCEISSMEIAKPKV